MNDLPINLISDTKKLCLLLILLRQNSGAQSYLLLPYTKC